MATWKISMMDGTSVEVEAHHAKVSEAGALYFTNNNEDCSTKIIAPGLWKEVDRTKPNPNSFPV